MKLKIFISHISEEAGLAGILKEHIDRDFLGMLELFVSTDLASISAGSQWLEAIKKALKDAQIELLLCSKRSIQRPWINFEAGAAYVKDLPLVPICHTDMHPSQLPPPYNVFQAIKASDAIDLKKLYILIAEKLGSKLPTADLSGLAGEIQKFEQEYGQTIQAAAPEATPEATPDLEKRARAGSLEAMVQLSLSGSPKAFDIIASVVRTNPDEKVRTEAISALVNLEDERKIPLLGSILQKEKWELAARCAQALGRSGDDAAIPYLIQALKLDVDWLVSQKSAEALGFFKASEAIARVMIVALNRGSFQGEAAKQSLVSQGQFAVPFLLDNLKKTVSYEGFSMTVKVLGLIGDKTSVSSLAGAKQRIDEFPVEDRWKRQLGSEIDAAIDAIQ
jgi:hypothetical protein